MSAGDFPTPPTLPAVIGARGARPDKPAARPALRDQASRHLTAAAPDSATIAIHPDPYAAPEPQLDLHLT